MTEKRFKLYCEDLYEYGKPLNEILDNDAPISQNQVCELLNDLAEENEQLRKQNEELIKSMQETARLSAKAITKSMVEERWGKGVDYD